MDYLAAPVHDREPAELTVLPVVLHSCTAKYSDTHSALEAKTKWEAWAETFDPSSMLWGSE